MKNKIELKDFDKQKFKNLISYFAREFRDDAGFNSIVLNKALYYADFMAHGVIGGSISGAHYIHKANGPVAREMSQAALELAQEGSVNFGKETPDHSDHPDLASFSEDELKICGHVVKMLAGKTAFELSDQSPNWIGWLYSESDEEIPYHTVFNRLTKHQNPLPLAAIRWAESELDKKTQTR